MRALRRRGREVEGTPLLREHAGKTCIEGSNPSVSARCSKPAYPARRRLPGSQEFAPVWRVVSRQFAAHEGDFLSVGLGG